MCATEEQANLWLRHFHPAPDAPIRLVCFPHAGGSASFYFPLSHELSPSVDVFVVQYPGRQDRRTEPLIASVDGLIQELTPLLERIGDKPTALFGHSMGALVAFEAARQIEGALGQTVLGLVASGRRAPSVVREDLLDIDDDATLLDEVRRLSGTAHSLLQDDDFVEMILPAIRADYKCVERYRFRAGPKLRCPIAALRGTFDPQVSTQELQAWSEHTDGGCRLYELDGGHFYMGTGQTALAAAIGDVIAFFLEERPVLSR
jgi:pyochelin biosynthesis protein PchC